MENIIFFIVSHCPDDYLVKNVLTRCILSVRLFYPKNKIVVIKTSVTSAPDFYENIKYLNTPLDGSFIYGAMNVIYSFLSERDYDLSYIFIHDSSVLVKKLPEEILTKDFYPLFYFKNFPEDHEDRFCKLLEFSKFNENEKNAVLDVYKNKTDINFIFGPMFGGKCKILLEIIYKLGINDKEFLKDSLGRTHLMCAERFLACCTYVIRSEYNNYVLSGSINDHPNMFELSKRNFTLEEILEITADYNKLFFYKTWFNRD